MHTFLMLTLLAGGRCGINQCQVVQQAVQVKQVVASNVAVQPVATVPITQVPVSVDLQSYQYAVNQNLFNEFRSYQQWVQARQMQAQQQVQAQAKPQAATQQFRLSGDDIAKIAAEVRRQMGPQVGCNLEAAPSPPPVPAPYAVQKAPSTALSSQGRAILAMNCQNCHQRGGRIEGGLVLFDQGGNLTPDALSKKGAASILQRVMSDDPQLRMPRNGELTPSDKDTLVRWLTESMFRDGGWEDPFHAP